jgi:hypothetical protein
VCICSVIVYIIMILFEEEVHCGGCIGKGLMISIISVISIMYPFNCNKSVNYLISNFNNI